MKSSALYSTIVKYFSRPPRGRVRSARRHNDSKMYNVHEGRMFIYKYRQVYT
jgi:hypothetical protein